MNVVGNDGDQETLINIAQLVGVLDDKPRKPKWLVHVQNLRKQ